MSTLPPSDKGKIRFLVEALPAGKYQENNLAEFLLSGLEKLEVDMAAAHQEKILHYIELMIKWNRAYNLTSVRDPKEIVVRHILDSLSVGRYLEGESIIDVGTGAGLPGIPLALAYPDRVFTLLDSNGKKARFLFQVQHVLKLSNVNIVNERVEGYQKSNQLNEVKTYKRFDTIIARAFSSLREMLYNTEHLAHPHGVFLAMKGVYPLTELHEIPSEFKVLFVEKLTVPFLDAERHLVKIKFNED